jgi:DNA-binding NtrC family response regulator
MSDPRSFVSADELVQGLLGHLDERACLSVQVLDQLVVGSLPVAEATEVNRHLTDCLACLNTFARLQSLHESPAPRAPLIVDSPSTRSLRVEVNRLARLDDEPGVAPPVLITGEIGTGKGVVARQLHASSRRASRAFVDVQCAAMSPSRLERALFGYERGAVDAPAVFPGLFESADGGVLFLDDVDALSLDLQGKVLVVLENRAVQRLGGVEARSVDVRVIAASHVDLYTAARRGTFRADLLGRFAQSTLVLVPLRERPEDILPLARHFAGQLAQRHGQTLRLTTDAEEQLRCYPWPGNVRELSDVIERAARRRARDEIGAEELGLPRA